LEISPPFHVCTQIASGERRGGRRSGVQQAREVIVKLLEVKESEAEVKR
jgi:hypothetical protein